MPVPFVPNISFEYSPTGYAFLMDRSPVSGIRGAFGSGKTLTCCAKIMLLALQQEPSPRDNIRYFKAAIVRNTRDQLRLTTAATWLSLFPEQECGPFRWSSPMEHHITVPASADEPGLDLQVDFLALDNIKDVRKLLSYEGTCIYFNEVREIPKPLIDAADGRVGRYPSMEKGGVMPTWYGVLYDTNPPDERHWLYNTEAGMDAATGEFVGKPDGWSFHIQPPAVFEVKRQGDVYVSTDPEFPDFVEDNPANILAAASRYWVVNPTAENLPHLPVHRDMDPTGNPRGRASYYGRLIQGKALDWIQVYLQGRFGYVREGKPVIGEFRMDVHVTDDIDFSEQYPIDGGLDIGGNTLQPAGVLAQRRARGLIFVGAETVASDMGLDRFVDELKATHARFGRGIPMGQFWGDPAGRVKDGIYETVAFDHLVGRGIMALPAPSNAIKVRIDAGKAPFNRMIDGKPGIIIHRRCANLIAALNGKWHYRELAKATQGAPMHSEQPEKNHPYSDVADAYCYYNSGSGETAMVQGAGAGATPERPFGQFSGGQQFNGAPGFDVF